MQVKSMIYLKKTSIAWTLVHSRRIKKMTKTTKLLKEMLSASSFVRLRCLFKMIVMSTKLLENMNAVRQV